MSTRSLTDVYQEKRIAAYEGWFKESSFSKPQNVYLTITVGHLFGEAYIMEQEGTQEGDPVYQCFVCSLEEITKVYVNDNVKSSPLFIQCDTDIKGVVHRKRIIIPCLENVHDIVEQIKSVHAAHMEKIQATAAFERRKAEEAKKERLKEQSAESREIIPPLPTVEKIKFDPLIPASVPKKKAKEAQPEQPAAEAPVEEKKSILNVLDEDMEKDLAALEKISNSLEKGGSDTIEEIHAAKKRLSKAKSAKPDIVPELDVTQAGPIEQKPEVPDELEAVLTDAITEAQNILMNEAEQTAEKIEDSVEAIESKKRIRLPKVKNDTEDELVSIELPDVSAIPDAVSTDYTDQLPDINDIREEQTAAEIVEEAVVYEQPVETAETVVEPEPVAETIAEPEPVAEAAVEPVYTAPVQPVQGGLAEFETAMRDLKRRKAEGLVSPEEFAAEKKRLMAMI